MIFIPTSLKTYTDHYRQRAKEGVITNAQADFLIAQLQKLKTINRQSLVENPANHVVNRQTYYQRNSAVVQAADQLMAFHIKTKASQGLGTQDTVRKARVKGIPVQVFSYNLQ